MVVCVSYGGMMRIVLAAMVSAGLIWGASFDCAKAKLATEKMICSKPELSAADERLADAYRRATATARKIGAAEAEALKQDELRWLRFFVAPCKNADCVLRAFQDRTEGLGVYAAEANRPPAATPDVNGTYESDHNELKVMRLRNGKLKFWILSVELTYF